MDTDYYNQFSFQSRLAETLEILHVYRNMTLNILYLGQRNLLLGLIPCSEEAYDGHGWPHQDQTKHIPVKHMAKRWMRAGNARYLYIFFSIAQKEPPEKIAKTRCNESESSPAKKRLKVLTRNK